MIKVLLTALLSMAMTQAMESDPEQKKEGPKFIILVHRTTSPELVEKILKEGLKSRETLANEKKESYRLKREDIKENDDFSKNIGSRIYFRIATEGKSFDENTILGLTHLTI